MAVIFSVMKTLGQSILIFFVVLLTHISAVALTLNNETVRYKVSYKWGLVHKQAGTATVTLRRNGNRYSAIAIGRSDPWADKFYKLRDTLRTDMRADFSPTRYEYTAHEDGKYSHDVVTFSHSGNTVTGHCTRTRKGKNDKTPTTKNTTLTAQGMTVDMLSSYYYLRSIDFASLKPGAKRSINIFSGKQKELLTFTYSGTEQLKLNGKTYNAYKVTFTFTSDGKKKTSEPIKAWVSTDAARIPLKLVGKLKIGQVQCVYSPGK